MQVVQDPGAGSLGSLPSFLPTLLIFTSVDSTVYYHPSPSTRWKQSSHLCQREYELYPLSLRET